MPFRSTSPVVDFPTQEKDRLKHWQTSGIIDRYLKKNSNSRTKFSFLDGPITANNPMGVHHAWGRTYKDLWQRYHNMKGDKQLFQNGFDCQGLWVEVEVEKELGFKSKKDIEVYGVDNFVNKCKERVIKYSQIQTEQSKRLGYFMDWENSYFTMSDENNYAIWNFIKTCWSKGWLYKGHDSVPWCPRCETAISQHEMLTEDYKEITHKSVYIRFPILGKNQEYLLVWTTTPWTIPANIAVAVDSKLSYSLVQHLDGKAYWVASECVGRVFGDEKTIEVKKVLGKKLGGIKYSGAFDNLPAVADKSKDPKFHTVVLTDPRIMPINISEGTGLVHTAVSAGQEDFKLGKKLGLPMIPVINDRAEYLPGLGELTGQNAKKHPEIVLDPLESRGYSYKVENYTHRYPGCWRCKTELVWKVADEWYISMDTPDPFDAKKRSFRKQMISVAKKITWIPEFGLERELDWLKNMHDWLVSKKNRYWGLALPVFECTSCHNFEVLGGLDELKLRAVEGWDKFNGHSPHRPWIDHVKIACSKCGSLVSRIADVGNPWLDAGIVSMSTRSQEWYPADFITESFPGQFKNWFYALIAMGTAMKGSPPFKKVLGFASLLAEDGRPMHKSWGNSIEFNEGADKIGVDVMRWLYATHKPSENLLFGFKKADETRRRFHLMLWNILNFFTTYANIDGLEPATRYSTSKVLSPLDRWVLTRLNETVKRTTEALNAFDPQGASQAIEEFVNDFSLWFIRRSRDRVGPSATDKKDKKNCYAVIHKCLVTLSKLLAPFNPFIADEIFTIVSGKESVHLETWPRYKKLSDSEYNLVKDMATLRSFVEIGLSKRKAAGVKVRQPLEKISISGPQLVSEELTYLLRDELNVKQVLMENAKELSVEIDTNLTDSLIEEGKVRELIRQIQELRKSKQVKLDQEISLTITNEISNKSLLEFLKKQVLASSVSVGPELDISEK